MLDDTPIARAIGYARNQRVPLRRFLEDGRLPIYNNTSENALRRQAVARHNWTFLGNDQGGAVTPSSRCSRRAVSTTSSPGPTCATCSA